MVMKKTLIIGTRNSKLALWQTDFVKKLLLEHHQGLQIQIREIITKGDTTQAQNKPLPEIGGKGLFTAELEEEIREGSIDIAVHSLKDLPTEEDPAFTLGAICKRASVRDVFVSRGNVKFWDLPAGSVIGTSSLRRGSQLLKLRPDLKMESIRGNVETRIRKVHDTSLSYAATVLAEAGMLRLEKSSEITHQFSFDEMLPAPGQGALAVQCRQNSADILELLKPLDCKVTRCETAAERSFLNALGAGCSLPVAAFAVASAGKLSFQGRCLSFDGSACIDVAGEDLLGNSKELGISMAKLAKEKGFSNLKMKPESFTPA